MAGAASCDRKPQLYFRLSIADLRIFGFYGRARERGGQSPLSPPVENGTPLSLRFFETFFFFPRSRRRKERGGGGEVENNFLILDWIGKFDESVESKLNFLSWRRRGVERWIISYFERGNNFKLRIICVSEVSTS